MRTRTRARSRDQEKKKKKVLDEEVKVQIPAAGEDRAVDITHDAATSKKKKKNAG